MTPLVVRTLTSAGLLDLFEAHQRGEVVSRSQINPKIDLMALGALADAIRHQDVGDAVYVFANSKTSRDGTSAPDARRGQHLEAALEAPSLVGLGLLREVATLRVTAPKRARVRVDWGACSLQLAQVALGFGANELVGPIANRRGLPIAEDASKKIKGQGMVSLQTLQIREIERVLRCAHRTPVFEQAWLAEAEREEAAAHG